MIIDNTCAKNSQWILVTWFHAHFLCCTISAIHNCEKVTLSDPTVFNWLCLKIKFDWFSMCLWLLSDGEKRKKREWDSPTPFIKSLLVHSPLPPSQISFLAHNAKQRAAVLSKIGSCDWMLLLLSMTLFD